MRFATAYTSCLAVTLLIGSALAADYKAGSISVARPWSRATPGGSAVAAGYMSLTNTGDRPDRLTGGTFRGAGRVEVHEMTTENGVMKMRPVPDGGIEIKPGATVTLKPGGYHLMFMDLTTPLKEGDRVPGSLTFENAGSVPVEFEVGALGSRGQHHHH